MYEQKVSVFCFGFLMFRKKEHISFIILNGVTKVPITAVNFALAGEEDEQQQ
ncbi:hypothetical protein D3C81_1967990 [compost metagenome]